MIVIQSPLIQHVSCFSQAQEQLAVVASLDATVMLDVQVAPTTLGIDDVITLINAPDTLVNLFPLFDDEDSDTVVLTYSVHDNTNAGLFDTVSFDPATGLLSLDYAADMTGTADLTVRATDEDGLFVDVVFNVELIDAIAAPVLLPEPVITSGTTNTLNWEAVEFADAYFVEMDDDPTFASPNENSGWITDQSHTFTDLSPSQTYHYRVKARLTVPSANAEATLTSESDFASGTFANTVVEASGDVTLQPDVPAPVNVDTIGGMNSNETRSNIVILNAYRAINSRTLTEIEMFLDLPSSTTLEYVVYRRSSQSTGSFGRIFSKTVTDSGAGSGFYNSGSIDVLLEDGFDYFIGLAFEGTATYYWSGASSPRSTDFGNSIGSTRYANAFPPNGSYSGNFNHGNNAYHQRLASTAVTGFAPNGSFTSEPIVLMPFDRWNELTFNITKPAETDFIVSVLPETGDVPFAGFEDVSSGVSLVPLGNAPMRLRAEFSTDNVGATPNLHDWTIQWQASAPVHFESAFSNVESSTQSGPPTTNGIDDVGVPVNNVNVVIDLFAAFDDVEDVDEDLVFTVGGNSDPSLFNSLTIDPLTGELTLGFAADTSGTADVTIRATDMGGDFVETTFNVTLNDLPTTAGIVDVDVDEDADDTVIDLFAAFTDAQDADLDLTFELIGNTNPDLFASTVIAIDGTLETGTLTLDYALHAFGAADLTVRVTDSLGSFIDENFTVTVIRCQTQVQPTVAQVN